VSNTRLRKKQAKKGFHRANGTRLEEPKGTKRELGTNETDRLHKGAHGTLWGPGNAQGSKGTARASADPMHKGDGTAEHGLYGAQSGHQATGGASGKRGNQRQPWKKESGQREHDERLSLKLEPKRRRRGHRLNRERSSQSGHK